MTGPKHKLELNLTQLNCLTLAAAQLTSTNLTSLKHFSLTETCRYNLLAPAFNLP
jgi:hypothetical protein